MRPQDAETLSVGGRRAHAIAACAVRVIVVIGRAARRLLAGPQSPRPSQGGVIVAGRAARRADVPQGRLDIRAAGATEALASRPSDGQNGKALFRVATERPDMEIGDGLDDRPALCIELPEHDQVVGQRTGSVARPGCECREERPLVDQAVLERQQSTE